ncbi:Hypothetical protein NGAL_HAMBI490_15760 [Neorhizobium galegae bv. officinalis]|nr:Hypothetical protein NGAL_HAMBI490_15760 [Neorhizobium galegae bv. officinalis]
MIRFSPAEAVSREPIKTTIPPVDVTIPPRGPILELEPTPEAKPRPKSTKPRPPKKTTAPAAEIVPQLDLQVGMGFEDKKKGHDD